jgi:hypothetical protein
MKVIDKVGTGLELVIMVLCCVVLNDATKQIRGDKTKRKSYNSHLTKRSIASVTRALIRLILLSIAA